MERCGSLSPAERPSISLICESLRVIASRAERLEARQPQPAEPPRAPLRRNHRSRAVVEEEEAQLSEELDGDGHADADDDHSSAAVRSSARSRAGSRSRSSALAATAAAAADEFDDDSGAESEESFDAMTLVFECGECSDSFSSQSEPHAAQCANWRRIMLRANCSLLSLTVLAMCCPDSGEGSEWPLAIAPGH